VKRLLVVFAATALSISCGSSTEPPRSEFDHLEVQLGPSRAFYPISDTARATVIGVRPDGTTAFVTSSARWSTPNSDLIALPQSTQSPLISMLARGTATIDVEAEGLTASVQLLVSGILHKAAIVSSETWSAAVGPHVVEHYLSVGGPTTALLTIEPGTEVLFRGRSGLYFGEMEAGRLVIPPGGAVVSMAGDSAKTGYWVGLWFRGAGQSELRNVSFRNCGGPGPFDVSPGCVTATRSASGFAPSILIDGVTITGAQDVGLTLDNWMTLAAGSRNLTIVDGTGHIASISAEMAGQLPPGSRFEGNADNTIWVGGNVLQSTTWVNPGVPLRLVSSVTVEGIDNPLLTLPAGLRVQANAGTAFVVGRLGNGRLIVGDAAGPPVVLESSGTGWSGIEISDAAGPSSLRRVVMRDCGASDGACLRIFGGRGTGSSLFVDDVTITGSRSVGVALTAEGHFETGSQNLTITGSLDVPIEIPPDGVPSIPPGNYTSNGKNVIRLRGTEVTRTAMWGNLGLPYLAPSGLDVRHFSNDPVLTLNPGVVLQMGDASYLTVGENLPGALKVAGTAANPVLITSASTDAAGAWIGLQVGTQADSRTRLSYVEIRNAGAGEAGFAGAVRMQVDPGGVLRNTTIRRSSTCGIVLFNGNTWAEDYTNPSFGNVFIEVAGPLRCRL
jgi:hypothetical protein